jgi:hypothetical protein
MEGNKIKIGKHTYVYTGLQIVGVKARMTLQKRTIERVIYECMIHVVDCEKGFVVDCEKGYVFCMLTTC